MQFKERLTDLMRKEGITNYRLARDLGTSNAVVGRWAKGTAMPSGKSLEAIAKRFGVSMDYLIGNSDTAEIPEQEPEEILDSISVGGVHLSITNRNISSDDIMVALDWLREQQRRNGH